MADEPMQQEILSQIDGLASRIDGLALAVYHGFERVDARFIGLQARLDTLTTEVHVGFERVDRRLGNLEVRVEGVETELRQVRTNVRGPAGGVTVLESKIDP